MTDDPRFRLVKRNKRLIVLDGETPIYTPPDFLRKHIRDRTGMERIVERFNAEGRRSIRAIMEFEGSFHKPHRPAPPFDGEDQADAVAAPSSPTSHFRRSAKNLEGAE